MENCSQVLEDQFFDACEDITSVSDSGSNCSDNYSGACSSSVDCVDSLGYEIWIKSPDSVHERRKNFFKRMGLKSDWTNGEEELGGQSYNKTEMGINRLTETSGAVLRNSHSVAQLSSSQSLISCCSNEVSELLEDALEEDGIHKIKNLDNVTEFVMDGRTQDRMLRRLSEVGSKYLSTVEERRVNRGSSPLVHHFLRREVKEAVNVVDIQKKVKKSWLQRLGAKACILDRQIKVSLESCDCEVTRVRRVRVHPCRRKRSKELSSLYAGQTFAAHDGIIKKMKFSHDGRYLATGGEDCIVRVWKVLWDGRPKEFECSEIDPSCLYFSINDRAEITHIDFDKEKLGKVKRMMKSLESAYVIFPSKVFRLLETPLHEFRGHIREVLDLSWSKNGYLLSASVDNTVRMWQVGCNQCLKVFYHNDYVTCVEFNPSDDNYFISGSIDGKVRIWEVLRCQVVSWVDMREIVTAVCYRPDGKGGIVGSMTGNCRFYNILDNLLQLDAQVCLQGKKKLPSNKITGFQICPGDPSKIMVTTADSQVRILYGVNIICKFKGLRNTCSPISASFTSDGRHIVSTGEDCKINIWNYSSQDKTTRSKIKSIWSHESFISQNATIAVPWCGVNMSSESLTSPTFNVDLLEKNLENGHSMPISPPDCLSLSRGIFPESLTKGSATWPEEKLPGSPLSASSPFYKPEYKFLKTAFSCPHLWGLVVVTAGLDGWIRTYQNYGLPIRL